MLDSDYFLKFHFWDHLNVRDHVVHRTVLCGALLLWFYFLFFSRNYIPLFLTLPEESRFIEVHEPVAR